MHDADTRDLAVALHMTAMHSILGHAALLWFCSSDRRRGRVSWAVVQVDMVDAMGSLVGTGNGVGLSTEQRKRLTIAVELVANPAAIFMVRWHTAVLQCSLLELRQVSALPGSRPWFCVCCARPQRS